MVKTTFIYDQIVPATNELEVLMNEGYKVLTSRLSEHDDGEAYNLVLSAVLVKEG